MAFTDKITKVINREIYVDNDTFDGYVSLVDYTNKICKERCGEEWSIELPPECECEVSRLYHTTVKLAEMEHSREGQAWEERLKIK